MLGRNRYPDTGYPTDLRPLVSRLDRLGGCRRRGQLMGKIWTKTLPRRAPGGSRTPVANLEGWCSTTKPQAQDRQRYQLPCSGTRGRTSVLGFKGQCPAIRRSRTGWDAWIRTKNADFRGRSSCLLHHIPLAGLAGFEPATPGFGSRCSAPLSYNPIVGVTRFERATQAFVGPCSSVELHPKVRGVPYLPLPTSRISPPGV